MDFHGDSALAVMDSPETALAVSANVHIPNAPQRKTGISLTGDKRNCRRLHGLHASLRGVNELLG